MANCAELWCANGAVEKRLGPSVRTLTSFDYDVTQPVRISNRFLSLLKFSGFRDLRRLKSILQPGMTAFANKQARAPVGVSVAEGGKFLLRTGSQVLQTTPELVVVRERVRVVPVTGSGPKNAMLHAVQLGNDFGVWSPRVGR